MTKSSAVFYTVKAELHCHTNRKLRISYFPFLYDSVQSEEEVLSACLKQHIHVLAITDHNSLDGYYRARNLIQKKHLPILLIPACEVSSADGHILAYNINNLIPQRLSARETIDRIHHQGGIVFAAHPFNSYPVFGKNISLSDHIYKVPFDGLEIYNASMSDRSNHLAKLAADKLGLPGIAGSDAHVPEAIGKAVVLFPEGTKSISQVIDCLKRGNFRTSGSHSPIFNLAFYHLRDHLRYYLRSSR
jgi:hypothetical protein